MAGINANSQNGPSSFVFPDSAGWNILNENQTLSFVVKSTHENPLIYFSIEGANGLGIEFDSLGHFRWSPSFDLVDRVQKSKDITLIFQQMLPDGKRERREVTFLVRHVNRPPVVEELPIVYVKQSNLNTYQIQSDFVYDPDGDPLGIQIHSFANAGRIRAVVARSFYLESFANTVCIAEESAAVRRIHCAGSARKSRDTRQIEDRTNTT